MERIAWSKPIIHQKVLSWLEFASTAMLIVQAAGSCPAFGALVSNLQLVNDGSSTPPGDRLDISLLFLPGDEGLVLELRAFYRQPGDAR